MNYQLGFGRKKKVYKLLLFEPSRAKLKLSSFNDRNRIARIKFARIKFARVRLVRARIEPELSHEPDFFFTQP
jgi:hypothetical protein